LTDGAICTYSTTEGLVCNTTVTASGDITEVIAGSGLTGGATTEVATLNIGAGTGITVNANSISTTLGTSIEKGELTDSGTLSFDWLDSEISDSLTITNLSGTNTGDQTITLTGDITGSGTGSFTTTIGSNKILESMLKSVNSPTDEYYLTYEATTGDFEWQTVAGGDVSKVGTPINNQIGVWTGDGTIEGTSGLTYDGSNLLLTGDIGITGTRITKGWFTDLEVTNTINGSITGNANTVTNFTPASGSLTLSGADALTLTTSNTTNLTLPTSGTLATTSELHSILTIGTANGLSLSTQALSLATASTSTTGALTDTDWDIFNNKQASLVSGTNIKTVNGATLLGSGDLGTISIAYGGTGATTLTSGGYSLW